MMADGHECASTCASCRHLDQHGWYSLATQYTTPAIITVLAALKAETFPILSRLHHVKQKERRGNRKVFFLDHKILLKQMLTTIPLIRRSNQQIRCLFGIQHSPGSKWSCRESGKFYSRKKGSEQITYVPGKMT
jgi:hypothetical protein